jgi:predicted flap endonuclease-1-like 5' DNA nuclease
MRFTYILIGVFFAWCVVAAQWYMFGVKGLLTDPAHFQPHETSMAIVEIVVMLLVAVLIGFGIAWFLRQMAIDQNQTSITSLKNNHQRSISELMDRLHYGENQTALAKQKLTRAQETFKLDFQQVSRENNSVKSELEQIKLEIAQKQEQIQQLKPKAQLSEVEIGRSAVQVKHLEHQLEELKTLNQKLEEELQEYKAKHITKKEGGFSYVIAGQRLGISEASPHEKDDLKLISGIGPVIEQKLNALGIYTFRQISEFTPLVVEQVTEAIKFFPDRIGRDNWIGQAAALARYKK